MSLPLVIGKHTQAFPQLLAQGEEATLIRAPQADIPLGSLGGARAVNDSLEIQTCTQVFLLGKLLQSAEDEEAILLDENKMLKKHILERTQAVESEWNGVAEQMCARVDTLYSSLNKFYQELTAEYLESMRTASGYFYSNNYYKYAEYLAVHEMHYTYAEGQHGIATYIRNIQRLRSSLPDTLKTALKEELHKNAPREFPGVAALSQHEIVVCTDNPIQAFIQNCQEKIQSQESYNLALRDQNTQLTVKKVELADMNDKLGSIFRDKMAPYLSIYPSIVFITGRNKYNLERCLITPKELLEFPFSPWAIAHNSGGKYAKELQLSTKINAHLDEIKTIYYTLIKKDSP